MKWKSVLGFGVATLLFLFSAAPASAAPTEGSQANVPSVSQGVEKTPANAAKAKSISEAVMTSADPQAAAAALSPADQELFKAYNTVVEVKPSSTTYSPADSKARRTQLTAGTGGIILMAAGCWNTSSYVVGTNAFGGWLWKSTVSGGFCTNGSSATASWLNGTWGETYAVGWRNGNQLYTNAILAYGQARIVGQREFILGVGGWDVQHSQPCIRLIGYGNGGTGADLSCNPW